MLLQRQVVASAACLPVRCLFSPIRGPARATRSMFGAAAAVGSAQATADAAGAAPMATDGSSFVSPVAVTSVDESQYEQQLQVKISKLRELFQEFDPPELEVFKSPPRQAWGQVWAPLPGFRRIASHPTSTELGVGIRVGGVSLATPIVDND